MMSMATSVIKTLSAFQTARAELDPAVTVGLVATMGGLHAGHLALLKQARDECDFVVGTIFVNQAQFNSEHDFRTYPRDLDGDLAVMERAGVDCVFAPNAEEMALNGDFTVQTQTYNHTKEVEARPNHFTGVLTVVAKFFNIVKPHRAYFGMKDAHQLRLVQHMAHALHFGLEIVPVATVREADGLALSSRNALLSAEQRTAATVLYKSLLAGAAIWQRGVRNCNTLRRVTANIVNEEPLVLLEYVSAADTDTLAEVNSATGDILLSVAAKLGDVRLIDNIVLLNEG